MKSLLFSIVLLFLSSVLILNSCFHAEKATESMTPVIEGAEILKNFYHESNRLPTDDAELLKFCEEKNITLDLSGFSKFNYYMSSDSTITIDFELKSSSENKGSFTIDI
jgi:hypothetical protein